MRKHCKRKVLQPRAPMMVTLMTVPELEIAERTSIDAFRMGYAAIDHLDNLRDCHNLLWLAGKEKADESALAACAIGHVALLNIAQRWNEKQRFGATSAELDALTAMVDTSQDFWKRQPGALFTRHYDYMRRWNVEKARNQQQEKAA